MSFQTKLRFGFNILLTATFALMAYTALDFQRLARYMPLFAASASFLLMVLLLIIDWTKYKKLGFVAADETIGTATLARTAQDELDITDAALEQAADGESRVDIQDRKEEKERDLRLAERAALRRVAVIWAWIIGYVVGIALIGITAGTAAFLALYLRLQAEANWKTVVIGTGAMVLGLRAVVLALNLVLPEFLVQELFFS